MTTKKKKKTLAQEAGYIRRRLKNKGVEMMKDHKGQDVPVDYIPPLDLLKHEHAESLVNEARELHNHMADFKARCQTIADDLHDRLLAEDEIREHSVGGFTLNDFGKNVRVKFKIDSVQEVDEERLEVAKAYKDKFIQDEAGDMSKAITELLNYAFERESGRIDPRRGRALNKLRSRIKNKNFRKFLDEYNAAFDIRHTKRYEMFQVLNDQGEWDTISLTYSRISPDLQSEDEE